MSLTQIISDFTLRSISWPVVAIDGSYIRSFHDFRNRNAQEDYLLELNIMYSIIETGGKQYWVVPGEILQVEKLTAKEGTEVTFKALWSATQGDKNASAAKSPTAKVTARVVRHLRGPKLIVFRKKTKKAYEKGSGHRQELTEIEVYNGREKLDRVLG